MKTIKIAVTGPEGCGKTILASTLSSFFGCPIIEDYCNFYLERKEDDKISPEELIKIAHGKINWESEILQGSHPLIISDGELTMLKIWSEFKFNTCSSELKDMIKKQDYSLYILINPDHSYKYDFKRENPSLRKYFFNSFKREFDEKGASYIITEGDFYSRKKKAVDAIEKLLKSHR